MNRYALFGIVLLSASICYNCNRVKKGVGQASEKAGEVIGEAAKGVSRGVENAYVIKIEKKDTIRLSDLEFGTIQLMSEGTGTDNKLSVYTIFRNDFDKEVILKVFDKNNLESGRIKRQIKGKKGETGYIDFIFDPHTNIDRDSRIVME